MRPANYRAWLFLTVPCWGLFVTRVCQGTSGVLVESSFVWRVTRSSCFWRIVSGMV